MAKITFTFSVLLFFPAFVFAENNPSIIINEIAWMGTISSANDEWIELFNNTNGAINLDGWILKSPDEKIKIPLVGQLAANGFFLLERTDDNSAPNAAADLIYTGSLINSGIKLSLYDNFNNLIDEVDCGAGWLAGNNETKQTMERASGNWRSSQNPGGTSKSFNGGIAAAEIAKPINSPPLEPTTNNPVKEIPAAAYPDGIVFSELMPSPEGADETNEWIELFNSNNSDVDLSGWKIQDTDGSLTTYVFPVNIKISAGEYLTIKRPETKIALNNEGDGLNLMAPDGKIMDSVFYKNAPKNQSYGKINSEWTWGSILTPGKLNVAPVPLSANAALPEQNKSDNEKMGGVALAAIGKTAENNSLFLDELVQNKSNPLILFLIAFAMSVISAIIILIIKIKFKNL